MASVASCGSWNRTNGLLVQSQASLPTATTPDRLWINDTIVVFRFAFQLGEKDLNLHLLLQRQVAYH